MNSRFFKNVLIFILLIFLKEEHCKALPQNRIIDSLQILIKKSKADTNTVIQSNKLCLEYRNIGLYDTALYYGNNALRLAQQLNFKKGIAASYHSIGNVYSRQDNYASALDFYLKGLKIAEEIEDKSRISNILAHTGVVYFKKGDYPKALDHYLKALKIFEEAKDKKKSAVMLGNIGNIYQSENDYPKALDYHFRALKMAEEVGDKTGIAGNLTNIGNVFAVQTNCSKALEHYLKALKMVEELKDKNTIALLLGNIGYAYNCQQNYPQALDYHLKALKMREEIGAKDLIGSTLGQIGSLYTVTGKFKDGEQYLKKSIAINESIGMLDNLMGSELDLSQLYDTIAQLALINKQYTAAAENYRLSILHYKKAITLKDTIFSQENKKQLVRKEMNYEFDKKEATTKAKHDKEIAVAEANKKKQKFILILVSCVLILVFLFAGFIFRSLRITNKQKNIIELQKNQVSKQKEKIIDSITYAQHIQQSILMEESEIQNYLGECFIYYQPKDIVSGDFYWCSKIDNKIIIAAIDCTGHGVPGAFMSMIGNTLLNQIVNEKHITVPSEILYHLNIGIYEVLNQKRSGSMKGDGMDIALCSIDYENRKIQYAGAHNPLFVLINNEIQVFEADKQSIGSGPRIKPINPLDIRFKSHSIQISKGMCIYLFTDGYRDQFAGIGKEKFGTKRFKNLIINNQQLPMSEQKEVFASEHKNWKGEISQTDDILILGIKF